MNYLFISPNSPFESTGGVERYIVNLTNYCKEKSDLKTVLVLPSYDQDSIKKEGNFITYFTNTLALNKKSSTRKTSEKARQFSSMIEKVIIDHKIDIICAENFHVGLPPAYSLLLNTIATLHNTPLVLRLHSFAGSELQTEIINQLMWKDISCVSKSVTGDCFKKGADIDLLSTDYLGVDLDEFNSDIKNTSLKRKIGLSPKDRVVMTASRIIHGRKNILKEKGVINLVRSFSKISPRYPDLYLLIAVATPPENLKDEFEQAYNMLLGYIKLHNIEDKTIVKTFKLNEMPDVYSSSDIFVLASENETFGQVFIEAMACGLPVIGTKVGGIPEIISDSYNGYLVQPGDSTILAQRIEYLIKNRQEMKKFIRTGKKTVENKFNSNRQLSKFITKLTKESKIDQE